MTFVIIYVMQELRFYAALLNEGGIFMTYRFDFREYFESVAVFFESEESQKSYPTIIKEDGYLATIRVNGKFVVFVKPRAEYPSVVFQVAGDEERNVTIRSDYAKRLRYETGNAILEFSGMYRLVFTTTTTIDGIICTKFPLTNDFRLARLKNIEAEIGQIAVVSQQGKFYFVYTQQYKGKLCRGSAGYHLLNCPKIDQWPDAQKFLRRLAVGQRILKFEGHTCSDGNEKSGRIEILGVVQWYNPALHYGIVRLMVKKLETGVIQAFDIPAARIHESALVKIPRLFKRLVSGDIVEIKTITTDMVDTRGFGTSLPLEVKDVELLYDALKNRWIKNML